MQYAHYKNFQSLEQASAIPLDIPVKHIHNLTSECHVCQTPQLCSKIQKPRKRFQERATQSDSKRLAKT